MEHRTISIPGYGGMYLIYEDGSVYSRYKNRFLKPSIQNMGGIYSYMQYYLRKEDGSHKWWKAHQLVAHEWLGPLPAPLHGIFRYEVDHIDTNKLNNHYSNLEYVTHQENMIRARNRVSGWRYPKHTAPPSIETRIKMSNAKKKRIRVLYIIGEPQTFESVGETCTALSISRKQFNRIHNRKKEYNTEYKSYPYSFEIISDII
jgi:hypothetical protein